MFSFTSQTRRWGCRSRQISRPFEHPYLHLPPDWLGATTGFAHWRMLIGLVPIFVIPWNRIAASKMKGQELVKTCYSCLRLLNTFKLNFPHKKNLLSSLKSSRKLTFFKSVKTNLADILFFKSFTSKDTKYRTFLRLFWILSFARQQSELKLPKKKLKLESMSNCFHKRALLGINFHQQSSRSLHQLGPKNTRTRLA